MSSIAEPRRPRLLPQNRKLRHLRGIWLRNLSFAPTSHRSVDDASLNTSLKKLPLLSESGQLHPSRSSGSLRKDSLRPDTLRQQGRRTSLSFAHINPASRQKKLEEAVEEAVGDVFYSLHAGGQDDPVYVSEVRKRSAVRKWSPDDGKLVSNDCLELQLPILRSRRSRSNCLSVKYCDDSHLGETAKARILDVPARGACRSTSSQLYRHAHGSQIPV